MSVDAIKSLLDEAKRQDETIAALRAANAELVRERDTAKKLHDTMKRLYDSLNDTLRACGADALATLVEMTKERDALRTRAAGLERAVEAAIADDGQCSCPKCGQLRNAIAEFRSKATNTEPRA